MISQMSQISFVLIFYSKIRRSVIYRDTRCTCLNVHEGFERIGTRWNVCADYVWDRLWVIGDACTRVFVIYRSLTQFRKLTLISPPHKSVIFRDNLFYNARLISKYYITNYSKRLFFKFYGKLLNGILKLFRLLLPIYNFTYRYI